VLRDRSARQIAAHHPDPFMRWPAYLLALAACLVSPSAPASDTPPDGSAPSLNQPPRLYLAVPLDREGKLAEALPLYRAQADATISKADRLRYAGALLRAGRGDEAHAVYEQISAEASSGERSEGAEAGPAICASSLLANGFPSRAVPYARQAHRLRGDDPTLLLLQVRALAASGDIAAARSTLQGVTRVPAGWTIGQRIEVARWRSLTGNDAAARQLLRDKPSESVAQMFRDSILANASFRKGDWATAANLLAASARKAPIGLGDQRVARAWRNAQRELWSVQLRRAITLWNTGARDLAVGEATNAQHSDEEYVHSAASLFLVMTDLANGRQDAARARLQALAGHDVRFAEAADGLAASLGAPGDTAATAHQLQAALGQLDRSADFVTQPLSQLVAAAARLPAAPAAASRETASSAASTAD
jgi:hypothetical protein